MDHRIAGIDVGGTNTKVGLVSDGLKVVAAASFPTETQDRGRFLEKILNTLASLRADAGNPSLIGLGLGVPGTVSADRTTVLTTMGFVNFMERLNLAEILAPQIGGPVVLDNDARAHALGEYLSIPDPPKSVVVATLGTGLGVGWMYNRTLLPPPEHGAMAGHIWLGAGAKRCYCGGDGCAEWKLSATSLLGRARKAGLGANLTTRGLIEAVDQNPMAAGVMAQYINDLKAFLQSIFHTYFPDLIVLGGGLAQGLTRWREDLQRACDRLVRYDSGRTVIKISDLGDSAGILGAAALVENIRSKRFQL